MIRHAFPVALALALLPRLALAQAETVTGSDGSGITIEEVGRSGGTSRIESPRYFVASFTIGPYRPQISREAALTEDPFKKVFGSKSMWLFGAELEYSLFDSLGTLSIGLGASFGSVSGLGLLPGTNGERSPDTTALRILPTRLLLTYHFDLLARRLDIPIVPYAKAGPAYTFWWAVRGDGSFAKHQGSKALGAKTGYQLTLGVGLELNAIDPTLGREFDASVGVNSVLLTGEWTRLTADNFGGKLGGEGIDLSDDAWLFGLMFAF